MFRLAIGESIEKSLEDTVSLRGAPGPTWQSVSPLAPTLGELSRSD